MPERQQKRRGALDEEARAGKVRGLMETALGNENIAGGRAVIPERNLQNANFVFFGGSSGIARVAALEVARRGANVLILARGRQDGEEAAAAARNAGATSAEFISVDLTKLANVAEAAAAVREWKAELHGLMHSAMTAFVAGQKTPDGLDYAFGLQYMARAVIDRLLVDRLAASGDGRIVHLNGNPPLPDLFMPDLDDLQFERRKPGFFKQTLPSHLLNFMLAQEAALRWSKLPVTLSIACVGPTKTKVMSDKSLPALMQFFNKIGTTAEKASRNAVQFLTKASADESDGMVLRDWTRYTPSAPGFDPLLTARLWELTGSIAARHGIALP